MREITVWPLVIMLLFVAMAFLSKSPLMNDRSTNNEPCIQYDIGGESYCFRGKMPLSFKIKDIDKFVRKNQMNKTSKCEFCNTTTKG